MLWLFCILSIAFILLSKKITSKWLNLVSIFNIIWIIIILLYQLRLSYLQAELENQTYWLFIASSSAFSISYFISYLLSNKQVHNSRVINKIIGRSTIIHLFLVWATVELIEIIYSGGIPIIWAITGNSKGYFDFGIPSVHGFMNALGLTIIISSYYLYIKKKQKTGKKDKILIGLIIFILIYYFFLITRQVIISAIIELITIRLCTMNFKQISKKTMARVATLLLSIGFVGIFSFGLIGNLRTGYEGFQRVAMMKNQSNEIFVGFDWVYMYLTMTIANINNLVSMPIQDYGMYPLAKTYLPTIVANTISSNTTVELPNYLVTKAFNVSGYFVHAYIGFKTLGVIAMGVIYGLFSSLISIKFARNKNEKNTLYFAIMAQIVILSFFYNHLLYLPSGFQLALVYLITKYSKNEDHNYE